MIVKFLRNKGGGSARATMDYLLGKDRNRQGAVVLAGDPDITEQLAENLQFKNRYTVGVLSFAENDLSHKAKQEIMKSFERTLLPGFERDQYDITWIEHRDKDRLELNFVIPKVELNTGRAMNPYFDRVDRDRVDTWKNLVNAEYDLHDPNDPANRQTLTTAKDIPKDKQEAQTAITGYLMGQIAQGKVKDRQDILRALESDLGLSVARITPNAISIKDPTNENGRNIRLKGEIYADTFRFEQNYSAENDRASRTFGQGRERRIQAARTKLTELVEVKRKYNQDRYSRIREPDKTAGRYSSTLQNDNSEYWGAAIRNHSGIDTDDSMDRQAVERQKGRTGPDQRPDRTSQQFSKNKGAQTELGNDQRLHERLQQLAERSRRAAERLTGKFDHQNSAAQAIDRSQSTAERTDRAITITGEQIGKREQQASEHQRTAASFAKGNGIQAKSEMKTSKGR